MAVAPQKAVPLTVNQTLRDRGIAHAVYLEKEKNGEAALLLAFFRDFVVPDLIEKLSSRLSRINQRGIDIDPAGTKRLSDMLEVMQETVDAWATGLSTDVQERAVAIGVAEVAWQDDLLKATLPIVWDTVIPPTAIIRAAVLESPLDGVLLKDIVDKVGTGTKANIERAVRIGIAEGEGVDKIVARVTKVTDFTSDTADAVVRTAVGHASNAGREAYNLENQDIIKGVQWHATLDTRTCPTCGALDGKMFPVNSGARPPRHIRCRCTSTPVLRSMKELGFDLADFPQSTRASMNGQVPESTTFNSWLKRMPPSIQDEALGPTRGQLFRTGKLEIKDFVSNQGEVINLDELRKREKAAWTAAKL